MTIDCCQNRNFCFLIATDCPSMTIDCLCTKIEKSLFSKIWSNLKHPSSIIHSIYSKYYFNKVNAWLKIVLSTKSIRSKISYTLSHKSWKVDLDQWIFAWDKSSILIHLFFHASLSSSKHLESLISQSPPFWWWQPLLEVWSASWFSLIKLFKNSP